MKKTKLVSTILSLVLICSLMTGCVGNVGEITLNKDGSGTITIQPSAQKVKVEGKSVILEGDSGSAMINGKAQQGTSQVDVQSNVTAKIEFAGQVKVKAN